MNKLLSLVALGACLAFGTAQAQDKPKTAQQEKMATCNKDAEGKKGDERKKFMSDCLKAKPAKATQQEKMKTCNKDAEGKKGDERKKFMSECLKAKPA